MKEARGLTGPAAAAWDGIVAALEADHGPLVLEWKASKSDFGRMCAVKSGKRTLAYLTPEQDAVRVGLVLGERAAAAALTSRLPAAIRALLREAKPYAEGRGIRFPARTAADVRTVRALVALKVAPPTRA